MKYRQLYEGKYDPKNFFGDEDPAVEVVLQKGQKLAEYIKQNCAPWLNAVGNPKLAVYRGFGKSGRLAFTRPVRHDRRPRDTKQAEHKKMQMMISALGLKANRENSAFVSGCEYQASEYGEVFVVLPIGEFNYTWSKQHRDWTEESPQNQLRVRKPQRDLQQLRDEYDAKRKKFAQDVKTSKKLKNTLPVIKNLSSSQLRDVMVYDIVDKGSDLYAGSAAKPFPNINKKVYTSVGAAVAGVFKRHVKKLSTAERKAYRKQLVFLRYVHLKKEQSTERNRPIGSVASDLKSPWLFQSFEQYVQALDDHSTVFDVNRHGIDDIDMSHLKKVYGKVIQGDNGSLPRAIKSYHEIMIHTDAVLAISEDMYHRVVVPILRNVKPKISRDMAVSILASDDYDR